MNRIVKCTAIAMACLGVAAALAGPAMASSSAPDPLSSLLGSSTGSESLLGGGQNPLMAVTSPVSGLTQSKNPLEGATQSLDGAGQSLDGVARVLPQGSLRNGVPLGEVADAAGVAPQSASGPMLTGASSAPLSFALLNGREIVGLEHASDPYPAMFGSLTGRAGNALETPALQPLTSQAIPQVTDRMSFGADHMGFMTRSVSDDIGSVSTHSLFSGPSEALGNALPTAVGSELEPVLGAQPIKQPLSARVSTPQGESPLDRIAPLVDGPLNSTPIVAGRGLPDAVDNAVKSTGVSADAVKKLTPTP